MEIWDGYFADGSLAGTDLIRGEKVPQGLYHLVCEVLVRHVDGDYLLMQRDTAKPNHPGCFEATAGGSALKGEDKLSCVRRELFEETGIAVELFEEVGHCVDDRTRGIYCSFLCVTDWNKESVRLQEGETMAFRWVDKKQFAEFIRSGEAIERQIGRYREYLEKQQIL